MRKFILNLMALILCLISFADAFAGDVSYAIFPTQSSIKTTKWKIGYYQGGEYLDYRQTLIATVKGLVELGWLSASLNLEEIELLEDTASIWKALAINTDSDYLSFLEDGFYTAGWMKSSRKNVVDGINQRIEKKNDIDLFIAMGTWAGQDLSKISADTNIVVMSSSDPVGAGIIKSPYESGANNLHAHNDPTFNERQIKFFHDVIRFKKLGMIFENSDVGKSYSGISSVQRLSMELGFEIVTCNAVSDTPDTQKAEEEYLTCIDKIASEVDALYITSHGGVTNRSLPMIVKKSYQYKLPTLSQSGEKEVERGLLMSLSRIDFQKIGVFQAAIIAKIFNGAKPGELNQVFEEPASISLNIEAARKIGYLPSADVIASADIIIRNNN